MQTTAYCNYYSTQDWAADPDLMGIVITPELVNRAEQGLALLRSSGFDSIRSDMAIGYELLIEDDEEDSGYVEFDPEYTLYSPDLVIESYTGGYNESIIKFVSRFKHTNDESYCTVIGSELAAYADKMWLESLGFVFARVPAGDDGQEYWVCTRPESPDSLTFFAEGIIECVDGIVTLMRHTGYDPAAFKTRMTLPELRKTPEILQQAA